MATLEEIIAAAARVFQTRGYHAATVQDIADAVGILKGSLYHHVKSEEDLLYLIVQEPIAGIYETMADIVATEVPAGEKAATGDPGPPASGSRPSRTSAAGSRSCARA